MHCSDILQRLANYVLITSGPVDHSSIIRYHASKGQGIYLLNEVISELRQWPGAHVISAIGDGFESFLGFSTYLI